MSKVIDEIVIDEEALNRDSKAVCAALGVSLQDKLINGGLYGTYITNTKRSFKIHEDEIFGDYPRPEGLGITRINKLTLCCNILGLNKEDYIFDVEAYKSTFDIDKKPKAEEINTDNTLHAIVDVLSYEANLLQVLTDIRDAINHLADVWVS